MDFQIYIRNSGTTFERAVVWFSRNGNFIKTMRADDALYDDAFDAAYRVQEQLSADPNDHRGLVPGEESDTFCDREPLTYLYFDSFEMERA